jgi:branched-subunit amino acid ABC-type transport system permease component
MLVAAGFWLVLRVQGVFSFSHATSYTAAAFVVAGLPPAMNPWCRLILGVSTSCMIGYVAELIVFSRLRLRGASSGQLVLGSLAVFVIGQALISAVFHDNIRRIDNLTLLEKNGMAGVGSDRAATLDVGFVGFILCVGLLLALHKTTWGGTVRAVACNARLAKCVGIRVGVLRLGIAAIAGGFAGAAGILWAIETAVSPGMGMAPLLLAAVATVVAGRGPVGRTLLFAGLIGIFDQGVMFLFAGVWHDAVVALAFGVSLVSAEGRGRE